MGYKVTTFDLKPTEKGYAVSEIKTDEQIRIAKIKDVTEFLLRVIEVDAHDAYWEDEFQNELEAITDEWYEYADYFYPELKIDHKTNAIEILNGIINWEIKFSVGEAKDVDSRTTLDEWTQLLNLDEKGIKLMRESLIKSVYKELLDVYDNNTIINSHTPFMAVMSVKSKRSDEEWMVLLNLEDNKDLSSDTIVRGTLKTMLNEKLQEREVFYENEQEDNTR